MAEDIPTIKSGLGSLARTHLELGMPKGLNEVPGYLDDQGYDIVKEQGWGNEDAYLTVFTIEIKAEDEVVDSAELDNPDATNTYGMVMEYSPRKGEGVEDYFFTSSIHEAFEKAENIVPNKGSIARH